MRSASATGTRDRETRRGDDGERGDREHDGRHERERPRLPGGRRRPEGHGDERAAEQVGEGDGEEDGAEAGQACDGQLEEPAVAQPDSRRRLGGYRSRGALRRGG